MGRKARRKAGHARRARQDSRSVEGGRRYRRRRAERRRISPTCARLDPASLPLVEGNPRMGPCVGKIGKFICIGLRLRGPAARNQDLPVPAEPVIFNKWTSAICGPNDGQRRNVPLQLEKKTRLGKSNCGRGDRRSRRNISTKPTRSTTSPVTCVINDVSGRGQWQIEHTVARGTRARKLRHVRPDRPVGRDAR